MKWKLEESKKNYYYEFRERTLLVLTAFSFCLRIAELQGLQNHKIFSRYYIYYLLIYVTVARLIFFWHWNHIKCMFLSGYKFECFENVFNLMRKIFWGCLLTSFWFECMKLNSNQYLFVKYWGFFGGSFIYR